MLASMNPTSWDLCLPILTTSLPVTPTISQFGLDPDKLISTDHQHPELIPIRATTTTTPQSAKAPILWSTQEATPCLQDLSIQPWDQTTVLWELTSVSKSPVDPSQHHKTNQTILAVISLLAFLPLRLCLLSSYKACKTTNWHLRPYTTLCHTTGQAPPPSRCSLPLCMTETTPLCYHHPIFLPFAGETMPTWAHSLSKFLLFKF
jgi:hypothetical protein